MALSIHTSKTPEGPMLVHPAGDVTGDEALDLLQQVRTVVAAGERIVVVDLVDVDFIDSVGLTVILQCRKLLKGLGGELRLARPHPRHRRLLSLTKIDRVVETRDSLADALVP